MKALQVSILFLFIIGLNACKKSDQAIESVSPVITSPTSDISNLDSFLVAQSNQAQNFWWYKNSDTIRPSSTASAHAKYFRVRFNAIANTALTENGKLPKGAKFPEGSMVVKELYDSSASGLKLLAILLKDSTNSYSSNGWIWAELKPDAGNYISATARGAACISCHSTNSRDYVRVFDLF